MNNSHSDGLDRRQFLNKLSGGALALSALLAACKPGRQPERPAGKGGGNVPPGEMTQRVNPRTSDKVSLLGFGMMRLPHLPGTTATGQNDNIDQEAVNELVDYAIANGVNLFDTSPRYLKGFSETVTGLALSRHPRDKFFISTKMSNMEARGYDESVAMYHRSMERLKVDYFDYYLVHAVGDYPNYKARFLDNGVLDFLLKEREAGRIRNLGWSFHGKKEFFDYMMVESGVKWDFVLIQLNYYDWEGVQGRSDTSARALYETLARLNVPALVMEPLLGGRLAKPDQMAQATMKRADPDASFASWAFRFAGSLPGVLSVLSGMGSIEHLQENVRTYSPLVPLTDHDKKMLSDVAKTMRNFIGCTGCQYCMPCPYGLNIPGIFAHYNRCLNEGNFPSSPETANYKEARRAFLIGMDRSVPKLRQASHCIGCGKCVPSCPQKIKIPQEMQRIDQFAENLRRNA